MIRRYEVTDGATVVGTHRTRTGADFFARFLNGVVSDVGGVWAVDFPDKFPTFAVRDRRVTR